MDSNAYERGRRSLHVSKAAVLALVAIIALAGFGVALAAITMNVSLADGRWSNARNASGNTDVTCLRYGWGVGATSYRGTAGTNGINSQDTSNTDRNEVRYGIPQYYSSCPTDDTGYRLQSGYGFDGQAPAAFDITVGQPFLLGQFTHFNWPIYSPSVRFERVDLTLQTIIEGVSANFVFTAEHDETPNNDDPCPYLPGDPVNKNGCADRVKFTNTIPSQLITIDGVQYTLQVLGFVPGVAGSCTYNENATVNQFITKEKDRNDACLFAKLIPPNQVDLSLTKDGPGTAVPGGNIVYDISVRNLGVTDAPTVVVSDTLNSNLQFVSASGDASCTASPATNPTYDTPQLLTCTVPGGLPFTDPVTVKSFQVTVQLNPNIGTTPQDIPNTACVEVHEPPTGIEDVNPNNNCDTTTTTTPVTLSFFRADREGEGVRFTWATSSETDNLGFNLYVESPDGWQKINDQIIPSVAGDSLELQEYSYTAANVSGDVFWVEDIDRIGRSLLNGPIVAGVEYGAPDSPELIDWAAITAEHAAKAEARTAAAKSATAQLVSELVGPEAVFAAMASQEALVEQFDSLVSDADLDSSLFIPLLTGNPSEAPAPVAAAALPVVDLLVEEDGLYRVSYEALQAAGYDFAGVRCADLALTNRGGSTPIRAVCRTLWGPGAYFEFYGRALDTLYSGTAVYRLQVSRDQAQRIGLQSLKLPRKATAPAYYMATATREQNVSFNRFSPIGDPWYEVEMRATSAKTWLFDLELAGALPDAGPAYLDVDLWGGLDVPNLDPDHRVLVKFNGVDIADVSFNGVTDQALRLELPANTIRNGANTLELTLPVNVGYFIDIVYFNKFSLTYPRAFAAQDGMLKFTAAGEAFTVSNLPSKDVIVYRVLGDISLVRLTQVKIDAEAGGTFKATFVGSAESSEASTYFVVDAGAPGAPGFKPARQPADITSGQAEYLVIAHPDFIGGDLNRLVDFHDDSVSVKVVNLLDIFDQYAGGELDPYAIRSYLMDVAKDMGVKDVLLVGADTYNYRGYLPTGGVSFVPTLYAATDDLVRFAPADSLLVDLNHDGIQDLGIGRLPVRTTAELATIVDKILAYANRSYNGQAVLSADGGFKNDSLSIKALLPAGWSVSEAYIDDFGGSIPATKAALVTAMNAQNDLVSFVGHSSQTKWSNQSLFTLTDAANMQNHGSPTVVTQWGCWNTYFVDPYYNTMGHKFLLTGDQGAAAVLGATALTKSSSERVLSEALMPKLLQPGMTMGQAVLAAKQELAGQRNNHKDVLLSWTLLGDPRTIIVP